MKVLTAHIFVENELTEEGAQAVADIIKTNATITELSLYKNKFGSEGAVIIAEALKANTTLTKLDFSATHNLHTQITTQSFH